MKNRLRKVLCALCAVLLLVTAVAGCGGGGSGGGGGAAAVVMDDAVFANYVYIPTYIDLPDVPDGINGAVVYGDRIFFFYTVHDNPPEDVDWETWEQAPPRVVVASVRTDGSDLQEFNVPISGDHAEVSALSMTAGGNIALLLTERTWGTMSADTALYYLELSQTGAELMREELDFVPAVNWFHIEHALFLEDGRMVIAASMDQGTTVYLLDTNQNVFGELSMNWTRGLVETGDGRVLMLDMEFDGERSSDVLREINLETHYWGESFPISIANARGMHPARESDPFDLIIDDGSFLFGYILETGERVPLFNWIETGFAFDHGYHIGFLPDGQISVLHSGWNHRDPDGGWTTELAVLRRTPRSEVPAREVVTLGGLGFWGDIRQQVVDFNRTSQTHRIEVVDYAMYSTQDDWGAGMTRFLADLATGQGTDMVWGHHGSLATLADRGILADLNPFIDADAAIDRGDFFENALRAIESADGTLPLIGNNFSIQTMIGNRGELEGITSWTFADMRALVEQTYHTNPAYLLGEWMTGEQFLSMALMFSGQDFIDWTDGRANLDNEEFIQLLEIAAHLPAEWDTGDRDWNNWVSHYELMQRGEQLLSMAFISRPMDIQIYASVLDDVRVLGVPTADGGAHLLSMSASLGMSASSPHQDVAWSFIRETLLPDAHVDWGFPLRISQFDAMLEEAMTPEYWTDEDGNRHEQSRGGVGFGDGLMIELYALTAEEGQLVRELVESASLLGRHDETIMEMIQDETLPFFNGDRSAADTARILQNRIQTFLSERR